MEAAATIDEQKNREEKTSYQIEPADQVDNSIVFKFPKRLGQPWQPTKWSLSSNQTIATLQLVSFTGLAKLAGLGGGGHPKPGTKIVVEENHIHICALRSSLQYLKNCFILLWYI